MLTLIQACRYCDKFISPVVELFQLPNELPTTAIDVGCG